MPENVAAPAVGKPPTARREVKLGRIVAHLPRYVLPFILVTASALVRLLLGPLMQDAAFLVFFPPVVAAAWYGGLGPAVATALMAAGVAEYFFLPPHGAFAFHLLGHDLQLAIFLITALVVGIATARLRQARIDAEAASRQLEALVASAADGIMVIDDRGTIRRVNDAAERIFGFDADELVGRNVSMVMPETDRGAHDSYPDRYRQTREGRVAGLGQEVRGRRKDGTTFPLEMALGEAVSGAGVLYTGIIRDITDRNWRGLQERLLAQTGEILTEALEVDDALQRVARMCARELADYCVTYVLEDGKSIRRVGVAHADPAQQMLVGRLLDLSMLSIDDAYGAGRVMRTGELLLVPEVSQEFLAEAVQGPEHLEVLRQLEPLSSMVLPFRARGRTVGAVSFTTTAASGRRYSEAELTFAKELTGRIAVGLDNLSLLRTAEGRAQQLERRQLELGRIHKALGLRERHARILSEAGHALASSLDHAATLHRIAHLAAEVMGDWAIVDLVEDQRLLPVAVAHVEPGRQALVERLLRWPSDLEARQGVSSVVRSGEPLSLTHDPEEYLQTDDPEHVDVIKRLAPHASLIVPMRIQDRTLGAITVISSDPLREYAPADAEFAQELAIRCALALDNARLLREATTAAAARDEMVAIVSHDLRSPLNTMLTTAQVLRDHDLGDEDRKRQLDTLIRAGRMMARLTDDLLDVTKMESGVFSVDLQPASAASLVAEVMDQHRLAFAGKDIDLRARVPEGLPPVVADRWRLLQLFGNLLGNALKFTPQGGAVTVEAAEESRHVVFRVRDNGPGIAEEALPRLFDRYFHLDGAGSGSGLGLTIARGIAVAHGGDIRVESRSGVGTIFEVLLPQAMGETVESGGVESGAAEAGMAEPGAAENGAAEPGAAETRTA